MTSARSIRSSKRILLSWKHKAIIALIAFLCVQAVVVAIAVADRVPPTVTTKDTTVQFGETLDVMPFARINDDRSDATFAGILVEPQAGTTVSDDAKTVTFERSGEYTITVFGEDESGNIGQGTFKVTVEPRPQPDPAQVATGEAQPDVLPFPIPEGAIGPAGGVYVVGQDVPAGLYKLIGIGERRGRVDVGKIRVLKHTLQDIDLNIAILDSLTVGGDFYGAKWVYLSEGIEFELDDATVMVPEDAVPETLYTQVHLDGMYCAGIDIEPGKYLIQPRASSESDAGRWGVAELFDFVVLTYVQDVRNGSLTYGDETDGGDEVWVYRGQFLTIDSCIATKISEDS